MTEKAAYEKPKRRPVWSVTITARLWQWLLVWLLASVGLLVLAVTVLVAVADAF